MSPELRQLRYFVAVAEDLHFGRAAARLVTAQPGLSRQIKLLERELGVQLFVRDKRHVEMTPAGEVFLEYCRLAIEMVDRAVASTRAAGQGKTALLRLGAYALGIYPVANEVLAEFGERFPQVAIDFRPGHSQQSFESLTRRSIDIAIVFAPFEQVPGVAYLPLGSIEPVVVVPSAHTLASLDRIPQSQLLTERVFMWPRHLNPPLVDRMRALFFGEAKHDDVVEIADITEMLVRVAAGEGVTMTNPMAAGLDIANVVVRRFEDPVPEFEYGIVWVEPNVAPFVSDFVDVSRELSTAATATSQNREG